MNRIQRWLLKRQAEALLHKLKAQTSKCRDRKEQLMLMNRKVLL